MGQLWEYEGMYRDPSYGAVPPTDFYTIESGPGYAKAQEHNTITCLAGGVEMLRCNPEGFWVRGVRVPQDDNEAQAVYNAFKAWMTWATLDKDYK